MMILLTYFCTINHSYCLSYHYCCGFVCGISTNDWYIFLGPDTHHTHYRMQGYWCPHEYVVVQPIFFYFISSSVIYCTLVLHGIFTIVCGFLLVYFLSFLFSPRLLVAFSVVNCPVVGLWGPVVSKLALGVAAYEQVKSHIH